MIIACSDSRVDPAQIFDVDPGEMFVVRNVAALVPPFEPIAGHHGVSAALEFAVRFETSPPAFNDRSLVKSVTTQAGNAPVVAFSGKLDAVRDSRRS